MRGLRHFFPINHLHGWESGLAFSFGRCGASPDTHRIFPFRPIEACGITSTISFLNGATLKRGPPRYPAVPQALRVRRVARRISYPVILARARPGTRAREKLAVVHFARAPRWQRDNRDSADPIGPGEEGAGVEALGRNVGLRRLTLRRQPPYCRVANYLGNGARTTHLPQRWERLRCPVRSLVHRAMGARGKPSRSLS